jgi:hypothetical protein
MNVAYPSVTEEEKELIDFVISSSASKNWDDFIKLVYSTYPIVTQERFSKLDLVMLAAEYEESIPLLDLWSCRTYDDDSSLKTVRPNVSMGKVLSTLVSQSPFRR